VPHAEPIERPQACPPPVLRLTPKEWRAVLERPSFLEREDNRFAAPRLFCGRPVEIVPDASFR
jgi:hypothetical protein